MQMRIACTLAITVLAAPPLTAQHGHGTGQKPPAPHVQSPTTHGNSSHATTPHTTPAAHHSTSHGASTHAASPSHGVGHTTTTKKTRTTTAAAKTTTTTGTTTAGGSNTALSPVQMKLQRNTNLASKLQSRLPAGTNLTTASAGFRNLGQFVAAVNVSHNLGIPFAQLKTRMVDQHMSLGQAIQDARPSTTNATTVASHAESEADVEIRSTATVTTTSATQATASKKHGGQ